LAFTLGFHEVRLAESTNITFIAGYRGEVCKCQF